MRLNKLILSILMIVAAPFANAVTLDLAKFSDVAKAGLENWVGAKNIKRGAKIYFLDGAGSTDLPPLYDYSAFYYVVSVKRGVLADDNLALAYRQKLNGDQDIVALKLNKKSGEFSVAMATSGIATFDTKSSEDDIQSLLAKLNKDAPGAVFEYFNRMRVLNYDVSLSQIQVTLKTLRTSPVIKSVRPNYEVYKIPFQFARPVRVKGNRKIDVDQYRTVTKEFKDQGIPFVSETTIPIDLQ